MSKRKLLFQLLVLAIMTSAGYGQKVLTLDACLDLGHNRNLDLKRASLESMLNPPSTWSALGQYFPSITVNYSIMDRTDVSLKTFLAEDPRNPGGSVIELNEPVTKTRFSSGYTIQASQTLFVGGRNYFNLLNTFHSNRMRDYQVNSQKFVVRSFITAAYCQTVAAARGLDVSKELVKQRQLQNESAQLRFQTGTVTKRDVMQTEVDLGRARNDSLAAALALRQSKELLNYLLNFPLDTVLTLKGLPELFWPKWNGDSLAAVALREEPNLLGTRAQSKIHRNNFLASWGEYLPQVNATLTQTRSEQSDSRNPFSFSPRDQTTQLGVRATWLLFDQFTRSFNRQESQIRKRQTDIEVGRQEEDLRRLVHDQLSQLQSIYMRAKVSEKNEMLAKETLDFEQERYRLGSGTVIDLSAAQVSYIEALREQITLETEFHIALAELEKATGILLRDAINMENSIGQ